MRLRVLLLPVFLLSSAVGADLPALAPDVILRNYSAASGSQNLTGAHMDAEFQGSLPGLKKTGKLHALRRISKLGRVTYQVLGFEGDNTVKKEVIARYMTAEMEAQGQSSFPAVTAGNYSFQYLRADSLDGRPVHVFHVTPKRKREGLFKGELWIDAETYLRVRESGYLVKSPSILVKRVAFVRQYEIRQGLSVPLHVESVVQTRLVGRAELTIDYSNFSVDVPQTASELE